MAGRLTISPFPTVTIDAKRDGDVDWSLNPYHHPSWTLYYRSAEWVETVVNRYLAGGPGAAAYRDRAKALLRDWLRDVPVQDRNPSTLVCSVAAFPGQSWIENQIPGQVDQYARHWIGAWNHGLMQDLTLLRIGCAYPAQAWGGRPLRWRALARRQMIAAFAPNRLGPAVDAQGVPNEQSTGYANFVYHLWTVAERELSACGYAVPAEMSDRVARMPMFVAQATQPDGNVVQIGDTYAAPPARAPGTPVEYAASMGAAGSPPAQRVAVYAAGYVFGRSGWGITRPLRSESFYSLRFGRGRQVHGHNDHMSVTYYARGRNLIVDSGHVGYEATPYRDFLRSPSANNVLVMPGVPFSATAGTTLIRRAIGPAGQFFEFTDTAFGGHPRDRSIYISQRPDLMVVLDRAGGAPLYQQLWHLDPGLTVTKVQPSYAVAAAPGTRLWIRQVALPGQVIPPGSTRLIRGQAYPYQGWVSRQPLLSRWALAPRTRMLRSGIARSGAVSRGREGTVPGHIPTGDIHHLRLTVTDVRRSRQFYTSLLGFEVAVESPPAEDPSAWCRCPARRPRSSSLYAHLGLSVGAGVADGRGTEPDRGRQEAA